MPEAQNRRKLRIGRIKNAIAFPFANFISLLRLALFPGLIVLVLSYLVFRAFWPIDAVLNSEEGVAQFMEAINPAITISYILVMIASAIVAVGIHRFIIRGEQPGWVIARFRWYELAYILVPLILALVQFCIMLVGILVMLAIAAAINPSLIGQLLSNPAAIQNLQGQELPGGLVAVAFIGFFVLLVLTMWIGIRLTLMLPHAAVQGSLSPAISWHAMKGNFWRFVLTGLLFGLFVTLLMLVIIVPLTLLLAPAAVEPSGQIEGLPAGLATLPAIFVLLYALVFPMTVALLSYIYKDLVGDPALGAGSASPA